MHAVPCSHRFIQELWIGGLSCAGPDRGRSIQRCPRSFRNGHTELPIDPSASATPLGGYVCHALCSCCPSPAIHYHDGAGAYFHIAFPVLASFLSLSLSLAQVLFQVTKGDFSLLKEVHANSSAMKVPHPLFLSLSLFIHSA